MCGGPPRTTMGSCPERTPTTSSQSSVPRGGPDPSRPDPDDSKIDGVRGGFGRRYGIDPVLFRVPRPRSRLAEVTLGLALIATAVDTGLSILGGFTWLDTTRIAAIALAVVAGGLLVGAVTRRGHGLLVVAGPLVGFVLLALPVHVPTGGWETIGDQRVVLTSRRSGPRPQLQHHQRGR